jgi:hypothetical protein
MGWMRFPRTTQEIRANGGKTKWVDGYWVCGRRRHLPTSYDDLLCCHQRTWKKHRKTRWK